jgi:hypothetical protein
MAASMAASGTLRHPPAGLQDRRRVDVGVVTYNTRDLNRVSSHHHSEVQVLLSP